MIPRGGDALPDAAVESSSTHGEIPREQSCHRLVADLATEGDQAAERVQSTVRSSIVHRGPAQQKGWARGAERDG